MPGIEENITILKHQLPSDVKLVAVSKTRPVSDIFIAYNSGQRSFGENRVQEILNKKDLLPVDIAWHLIGHLQSNKVKSVVPFISMIQSVDSFRLLSVINTEAEKIGRIVDCLLQIYIAEEETKFGFSIDEIYKMAESELFQSFQNVRVCGVMGMATFSTDNILIEKEFSNLATCFKTIKEKYFNSVSHFKEISMGMSGDYEIALRQGATMVRIGSLIFGERNMK